MWSIHCLEGRWSSRGSDTVPPSRVPQLLPAGLQPSFSRIAASSGLYLLGICSLQIIFRNFRGMNPRLTTSAFMRSSEKRMADEFKRSLILAWAQPAFLVVVGVRQACAHRRDSRGQRTTQAHSLILSALPLCSHSKHHGRKLQRGLAWSL